MKKKANRIFWILIIIEFVLMVIGRFQEVDNNCGAGYSFLNPFGHFSLNSGAAISMCLSLFPSPLYWIMADLLILTVCIYVIYLIVALVRRFGKNDSMNMK